MKATLFKLWGINNQFISIWTKFIKYTIRAFLLLIFIPVINCTSIIERATNPGENEAKVEIMKVEELGQLMRDAKNKGSNLRGYGLTVFEGTKIERFEVEFVDILEQKGYITPRIVVKVYHPVTDKTRVISGMSGSPVYASGKLVGAIAWKFNYFEVESLAGVTPAEYMISELSRVSDKGLGFNPVKDAPIPVRTPPLLAGRVTGDAINLLKRFFGSSNSADKHVKDLLDELSKTPLDTALESVLRSDSLMPLRLPLIVSGPFTNDGLTLLERLLGPFKFMAMPGGSGSAVYDHPEKLEPGCVLGVLLVDGDISMAGIGTCTYVDDENILAFGHYMYMAGLIEMPITTGVVHTVSGSGCSSYKMSSAGKIVGSTTQDRYTCITGKIGKLASMIPVTIKIVNPYEKINKEINISIVNHPNLFPRLFSSVNNDMQYLFQPSWNPRTIVSKIDIKISNGKELYFEDVTYQNPIEGSSSWTGIQNKVAELITNQYEKIRIEKVTVTNEYIDELRMGEIKNAWVLENEVEDGGKVHIKVVLKKWRGPEEIRDIEIQLPQGIKKGTELLIDVAGGSVIAPERAPASNLEEFIETLQKEYKSTYLVAITNVESYTLMYKGKVLERIPGSILAQLVPAIDELAVLSNVSVRNFIDAGLVIVGRAQVRVKVK